MYRYRAKLTRVVDADTLDLDVDLGFRMHALIRVRLARIDAWEVRGEERERGLLAKQAVLQVFETFGADIEVITSKDTEKYGRWLAEIFVPAEDVFFNLNDYLVTQGHAVPSNG